MANNLPVLLIDDDPIDRELFRRASGRWGPDLSVLFAENGQQGLEVLREQPKSCLVLVDLNMPVMNGFEFLEAVRADPTLANTTIFVLTTSEQTADIERAYDKNVAGYLVKSNLSNDYSDLVALINSFQDFVEPAPRTPSPE